LAPISATKSLIFACTCAVSWFMLPDWSTTQMMSDGTVTKSAATSVPAHDAEHMFALHTGRSSGQSALDSHCTQMPFAVQIGASAPQSALVAHSSPTVPPSTSSPAPLLDP